MTPVVRAEHDHAADEPWRRTWPANGLERVDSCPVCGSATRVVCHEGLVDSTFRTAPGTWTLWRCVACAGAYLSPRPTADTLHEAYASYYTHQTSSSQDAPRRWLRLRRVHRWLANGYANWRYGAREQPATRWGVVAAAMLPLFRNISDREYRHLPRVPDSGGALLDVGCGDGSFLALARACGWQQVLGLEPDPKAARLASQTGVRVIEGGLEVLASQSDAFDVITLSHVIEHVHDPLLMLRACHRLLKPGGQLWLETPNVSSLGHRVFGRHWRGLEAPRHLVLFSPLGLALKSAGFEAPAMIAAPSARRWIFKRSLALSQGRWPSDDVGLPAALQWQALMGDLREAFRDDTREFLTMRALKSA
jgi:2-polyprenyl-3-methyl-5-hydroxy-6-metoxy-1,4-benzoquinol methylase